MSKLERTIGGVLAAGLAVFAWKATQAPAPPARALMNGVDLAALEDGAPMVNVKAPDRLPPKARIGERIFNAKCASCHGENAAGRNGMAPPLIHSIYRPGHHADEAFQRAAAGGVRSHHWTFGDMPPVKGLTRAEVASVISYVRAAQQENGIF